MKFMKFGYKPTANISKSLDFSKRISTREMENCIQINCNPAVIWFDSVFVVSEFQSLMLVAPSTVNYIYFTSNRPLVS